MKKIISVFCVIILTCTFTACGLNVSNLKKSAFDASKQSKDVIVSIKEKDIKSNTEKLTLSYNNTTDKEYTYGLGINLDIQLKGTWYEVPPKRGEVIAIACILPPNKTQQEGLSIKDTFGKLKAGKYRIVKQFSSDGEALFSTAEFTVE